MLRRESGRTHSPVSKLPQRSSLAVTECRAAAWRGTLQTKPRTGVCETLMPDVVVPEAHQNDRNYVVSTADLLSSHYTQEFTVVLTWAVEVCVGMGACPGQYGK